MAPKIRVFVSYSHDNTAIRKAVVSALCGDPSLRFECRWDTAKAYTAELHDEISFNLDWCDVVVPSKIIENSGVFLWSTSAYLKLASKWSTTVDSITKRDFGILSFDGLPYKMFATLDATEFRYRLYEESDPAEGANRVVAEIFNGFKLLGPGEFDHDCSVCRWSPDWSHSDDLLARALEQLFKERPYAIYHLVLLKAENDSQRLGDYLYTLSARL